MANELRFVGGELLFVDGDLAMSEDCCCDGGSTTACEYCTDSPLSDTAQLVLAGYTGTSACLNGTYNLTVYGGGCGWTLDESATGGPIVFLNNGNTFRSASFSKTGCGFSSWSTTSGGPLANPRVCKGSFVIPPLSVAGDSPLSGTCTAIIS